MQIFLGGFMNTVRLKNGIFYESQQIGAQMLMNLSPDRLLAPFYEAAGKTPKALRYGGWESKGISGHTLGHYLTALSLMYESTGEEKAKERALYVVDELDSLQDREGYVCGFPKKEGFMGVFDNPEAFTSAGFDLAGWWVPYYTLHKIMRGLVDCYEILKSHKALAVVSKLAVWVYNTTSTLNDEQRKRLLKCEYGGMNCVLSRLYKITGDERFQKASLFFCEEDLLLPLSCGDDILSGLHANTQIPKIIGALEVYKNGGDKAFYNAAKFFFDTVTENRSYVIGGHGAGEHFSDFRKEPLETNTCETCNSNNMLTLANALYEITPDAEYYDYCEKVLYNHILASQDETGMKTYFVGLKSGHFKVYSTPEESFWCCFGSGLENPFTYNRHIYRYNGDVYINLFIAATFKNETAEISLDTDFPSGTNAVITVGKIGGECIFIRKPCWCREFRAEINGKIYTDSTNGYVKIENVKAGDKITVNIPCDFAVYRKKDDDKSVAYLYGPIVLCEPMGKANFPETDRVPGENDLTNYEGIEAAPLNSFEMPEKTEKTLAFRLKSNNIQLVPFYSVHHQRYRVYFEIKEY